MTTKLALFYSIFIYFLISTTFIYFIVSYFTRKSKFSEKTTFLSGIFFFIPFYSVIDRLTQTRSRASLTKVFTFIIYLKEGHLKNVTFLTFSLFFLKETTISSELKVEYIFSRSDFYFRNTAPEQRP